MKINDLLINGSKFPDPSRSVASPKTGGSSFSNALSDAIQKAGDTEAVSDHFGLLPVTSVSPALVENNPRLHGLAKGGELLDVLSQYGAALADPNRTLKEAGQILNSATKTVQQVEMAARSLPPSDPLSHILNETRILAAVEKIKFDRGDYL